MKAYIGSLLFVVLFSLSASAQQTSFQDSLLDHMTGEWVMTGTIMGQGTTHDVSAKWVLAHQYMQLHEVSREKDSTGKPIYEAFVYLGWDRAANEYDCLWLDVTSGEGLNGKGIGHGKRSGENIPFLFNSVDGSIFHTTFTYNGTKDTWKWIMDGETNGKLEPFARLALVRK